MAQQFPPPPPPPSSPPPAGRRTGLIVTLVAVIVALLAVVGVAGFLLASSGGSERAQIEGLSTAVSVPVSPSPPEATSEPAESSPEESEDTSEKPSEESDESEGSEPDGSAAASPDEEEESPGGSDDGASESPEGSDVEMPPPAQLGLEQRHPNGVLVRLESVRYEPTFVSVEVTAVNGYRETVTLASSPFTGATLVDDLGGTYSWLPPRENESLMVEPGATLSGTLVFGGELDDEATSLLLQLNEAQALDEPTTIFPGFEFTWDVQR